MLFTLLFQIGSLLAVAVINTHSCDEQSSGLTFERYPCTTSPNSLKLQIYI